MKLRALAASVLGGALGCVAALGFVAVGQWAGTLKWLGGPAGLASWVQAIGSVAAIYGAVWIALRASKEQRIRDEEARNAILVAAYMMVSSVLNQARKGEASLRDLVAREFWILEAGDYATDLRQRMRDLPIHSAQSVDALMAFENSANLLEMIYRLHRQLQGIPPDMDRYDDFVEGLSNAMAKIADKARQDLDRIEPLLREIPQGRESIFDADELADTFKD